MKTGILIISLLFTTSLFSQVFSFGVKGSGMISSISSELFALYAPGYQAGLTAEIKVTSFYNLGIETSFQMRRTSWTAFGSNNSGYLTYDEYEINRTNFPFVNFSLYNKFRLNDQLSLYASPEFGLALGEIAVFVDKGWSSDALTGIKDEDNDRMVSKDMYDKPRLAIGASVGIEYLALPKLAIDFRFQHDIVHVFGNYWSMAQLGIHYYFKKGSAE